MAARAASVALSTNANSRRGQYVDSIEEAAASLRAGGLVAFPTETVYGLGAHAMDAEAVARIFTVKGRPRSDPLIVHVSTPEAAEKLVRLDSAGLALMRRLMAAFSPGPLTLVAPACPELPSIITAGTGFVGVRIPKHARAMALLQAAAIPVAAPSANRFGHEHKPPPPLPADAEAAAELVAQAAKDAIAYAEGQPGAEGMLAPGMSLTHYAPDLPSFLLDAASLDAQALSEGRDGGDGASTRSFSVANAIVLDYGAQLDSLQARCLAYRDLSPAADASEAAAAVFDALRWAEAQAVHGGRCVLLPDVVAAAAKTAATEAAAAKAGAPSEHPPAAAAAAVEMAPALADRLFRAASGRTARLAEDGTRLVVDSGEGA